MTTGMQFQRAACPSCSGELQVPTNRITVQCMYCGSTVVVQQAIAAYAGPKVENILHLADASARAGNYQEAYRYFSQAIEYDASNPFAWHGRGISAGMMSTLAAPRLREMTSCLADALARTRPEQRAAAASRAATDINTAVGAYMTLAANHFNAFMPLPDSWPNYIASAIEALNVLEYAYSLDPNCGTVLESMLNIINDLLRGRRYRDPYHNGNVKLEYPKPHAAELLAKGRELRSRLNYLTQGGRF